MTVYVILYPKISVVNHFGLFANFKAQQLIILNSRKPEKNWAYTICIGIFNNDQKQDLSIVL